MSHNLALLPSAERQRIELIKQAHLLVWRLTAGRLSPSGTRASPSASTNTALPALTLAP